MARAMPRRLNAPRLVVASHNPGKVVEISALLEPFGIAAISARDLDLPEPEETGDSFVANAELKARAAAEAAGEPTLADDSGLVVPALGGAPGIYSARWSGPDKDFSIAMTRVEHELGETDLTDAHFVCALALCWPDGHCETFEGTVHGHLSFPPRGDKGFGYDPIFVPAGHAITFGEMNPAEKDRISHRADAFRQLVAACLSREGEASEEVYVLTSGRAEVYRVAHGERQSLGFLESGDVVGELAFLTRSRRTASVVAVVDSTLLVITPETLERELNGMQPWMAALTRSLAKRFREREKSERS